MSDMSTYLEDQLLQAYFKDQNVYVALFSARTDEDAGTELSAGNGYTRMQATFGAISTEDTTKRKIVNDAAITWPLATGNNGDATHWAVFDASSGGNQLSAILPLPATISYVTGTRPQIAAGALTLIAA